MKRYKLLTLFLVLVGIVIGTFVATLCKDVSYLSWLAYGVNFGMASPLVLDLGVMQLTFAASIDLTLSVVIFIILSVVIGRIIAK